MRAAIARAGVRLRDDVLYFQEGRWVTVYDVALLRVASWMTRLAPPEEDQDDTETGCGCVWGGTARCSP